ncbi:succinate dehydrogenase, cytochrome b556 subunit [Lentibacter algarum]|uniref:succinate dehydrogenase, cytochrome b556 subunit n=1 Tax=Lentibacter algarum TaxID=576131 RepID=UPI001C08767F|nr:succinate dehydrogenase, cytochrome b556 subunit [Lentibacter algarum]MBU2983538.1 succinate dehydrogenase, cytochrome b556 subunit [Lentibacter algarum]
MADSSKPIERPLSPHLTIYRPQLTSGTSILVRITAIALFVLAILPVWWLAAAATSHSSFAAIDGFLQSWFGSLVMFGATWAIFYHMLGRLRHVIWDLGYCLDVEVSEKMGLGMLIGATVLTVLVAIIL